MDEEEEGRRRRRMMMESLTSSFDNKYPRDLLQRLKNDTSQMKYEEHELEQEQEQELELGLSLGGRFGVDKTRKLTRSSSISVTMPFFHDGDGDAPAPAYGGLMRSSSLPTETEEEWRKRKDLQTLRRLAVKRRRSEKQRSSGAAAGAPDNKEDEEVVGPNSGNPFWNSKGKNDILGEFQGFGLQASSVESSSQGGSSTGLSEMESKSLQGSGSCGEARSPASNQDQQSNQGTVLRSLGSLTPEHASRISRAVMTMREKPITSEDKGRETRMNHMEDMPCVFTKGDGPNGRKIDGILYRYAKGEEVRIMCVCHGTFLSPAEFVKHAGGGEVTNPLRHIVVNPAATSFL